MIKIKFMKRLMRFRINYINPIIFGEISYIVYKKMVQ